MPLQFTVIDSTITIVVDAAERADRDRQHEVPTLLDEVERAVLVFHEVSGERLCKQQRHQQRQRLSRRAA
jgi:hypothetical protein